jgi:hypothetical protein
LTAATGCVPTIITLVSQAVVTTSAETVWTVLTATMLQTRIGAPLYAALTSTVIQGAQADPIPQLLSDVTSKIRGAILDGNKYPLAAPTMIPPSLVDDALAICNLLLCERVAILKQFSEAATPAANRAEKNLTRIREGGRVELPSNPMQAEAPPSMTWGSDPPIDM